MSSVAPLARHLFYVCVTTFINFFCFLRGYKFYASPPPPSSLDYLVMVHSKNVFHRRYIVYIYIKKNRASNSEYDARCPKKEYDAPLRVLEGSSLHK